MRLLQYEQWKRWILGLYCYISGLDYLIKIALVCVIYQVCDVFQQKQKMKTSEEALKEGEESSASGGAQRGEV